MVMLHCVGAALLRLVDFPLDRLQPVRRLWEMRMVQTRSHTRESEVWSEFSQTIESGEAHLGEPETSQDECLEICEIITGDR